MTDHVPSTSGTSPDILGRADEAEILGGMGEEVVDGLPVLAEVHPLPGPALNPLPAPAPVALPAVQAAAAAATGFVAGAATLALCRRLSARRLKRTRIVHDRALGGLPIVGTRSFLVDVHLIAKPQE